MSRIYGYDIISKLYTQFNSNINTNISAINTARSLSVDQSCPAITTITTDGVLKYQLPELFIAIAGTELDNESDIIGTDIDSTRETYSVEISIFHNSNSQYLSLHMELFMEAIYKTIHQYHDADITITLCQSSIRDELYNQQNETMKIAGYLVDIIIN